VSNHVLGDEDRDELVTVVNGDCHSDHERGDGGSARPGLDDPAVADSADALDLLGQVLVDKRSLAD